MKERESSMIDEPNPGIEAILGEDPGHDPERRASLAAGIAAALDSENGPSAADAMLLAAYLDGGLNENEKEAVYAELNASGLARIELASAVSLLAAVEQAPQRPPAELMAQAGALLNVPQKQRSPLQISQWLSASRLKLGFGLAFTALVAMVVWNPIAQRVTVGPALQPATPDSWRNSIDSSTASTTSRRNRTPTPPQRRTDNHVEQDTQHRRHQRHRSSPDYTAAAGADVRHHRFRNALLRVPRAGERRQSGDAVRRDGQPGSWIDP